MSEFAGAQGSQDMLRSLLEAGRANSGNNKTTSTGGDLRLGTNLTSLKTSQSIFGDQNSCVTLQHVLENVVVYLRMLDNKVATINEKVDQALKQSQQFETKVVDGFKCLKGELEGVKRDLGGIQLGFPSGSASTLPSPSSTRFDSEQLTSFLNETTKIMEGSKIPSLADLSKQFSSSSPTGSTCSTSSSSATLSLGSPLSASTTSSLFENGKADEATSSTSKSPTSTLSALQALEKIASVTGVLSVATGPGTLMKSVSSSSSVSSSASNSTTTATTPAATLSNNIIATTAVPLNKISSSASVASTGSNPRPSKKLKLDDEHLLDEDDLKQNDDNNQASTTGKVSSPTSSIVGINNIMIEQLKPRMKEHIISWRQRLFQALSARGLVMYSAYSGKQVTEDKLNRWVVTMMAHPDPQALFLGGQWCDARSNVDFFEKVHKMCVELTQTDLESFQPEKTLTKQQVLEIVPPMGGATPETVLSMTLDGRRVVHSPRPDMEAKTRVSRTKKNEILACADFPIFTETHELYQLHPLVVFFYRIWASVVSEEEREAIHSKHPPRRPTKS